MRAVSTNLADASRAEPGFVPPMLATVQREPPTGRGWAFEFKWDGVRCIARWDRDTLTLWARRGGDISHRYPELHDAAQAMFGDRRAIVDGEIIALDDRDRPSFSHLQRRMHVTSAARARQLSRQRPAWFMAFDVLWLDGRSVMPEPYLRRRVMLEDLALRRQQWQTPPNQVGGGEAMLDAARDLGLEGIVAKQTDSHYVPGLRSDAWRKVRVDRRQEFVIGGWTPGKGMRTSEIGALLLGYYEADALRYAGLVGSGFSGETQRLLLPTLRELRREDSPFSDPAPRSDATFVEPKLVAEVKFTQWTPDGVLRHPSYLGLRTDKAPRQVVRET